MSAPYVPFYPSDWLAGTRALSAEETGVYITIIAMIYEREAPIDMPDDRLSRLCGCGMKAFRKAVEALIAEGKLVRTEAGLWNERAEKEIEKRAARTQSAKSSVEQRWKKAKQKQRRDDTNVLRTQYADDTNQNQNHIRDTSPNGDVSISHANDTAAAVTAYNDAAGHVGWPKVQRMTPARSKALRARLAECGGTEGWEVALRRAMDSDFLCGRTAKPWTGFGFDWLTKSANFTKLMEGNYDNRDRPASAAPGDATLRAISAAAGAF